MESAAGAKQPTIDQTTAAHINILEMPQSVDAWPEQSSHRTDRSDAKSLQNKKIKKKKTKTTENSHGCSANFVWLKKNDTPYLMKVEN